MISGVRSLDADFHGLSSPRLAQDGSPVYGARTPEGEVVVFFMREHGPPVEDLVSPVIFTPDGKHVGYVVRKGDSFVEMQNHKPGAIIPAKRDVSFVPQIMISRDGGHLAYEVMLGGKMFKDGDTERALRRVVLDGAFGPEFDCKAIQNITISEGGKHHFYEVHGAQGERDQVVFDGMEGLYYDDVFRNSTRFLEDHAIEFVAKEGQRLLRVTESLN
jgi:hypothetical protein